MKITQKGAIERWKRAMKEQLTERQLGGRHWWRRTKQMQGFIVDSHIPPMKNDGSYATTSLRKADMLSSHFAKKINVKEPLRSTPELPKKEKKLSLKISKLQRKKFLKF